MKRTTFIYGLKSNKTNKIRYVGKSDNPEKRLKNHILDAKKNLRRNLRLSHKERWLIKEDFNVSLVIIEECDYSRWEEREIFYINEYDSLTNVTKGGEGASNINYSLTYDELKKWVADNVGPISKESWYKYIKENELPNFVPKDPREVYLNRGWISWGDFLGTGNKHDNDVNYLSYDDAKKIIRSYNFKTLVDYKSNAKSGLTPDNIPNRPERYYKKRGWISWGDFLGTGRIANQLKTYLSYDEAKKLASTFKFKSRTDWNKQYYQIDIINKQIPKSPENSYKNNGWISWGDFLGTGRIADQLKVYLPYDEAILIVRGLNLKSMNEWKKWFEENKPTNLPKTPEYVYREKGWINVNHWLRG